jgi:tetratricopeptide (TPR) repeat protein
VFAGGWTLDGAEQVCGFAPLKAFEVLDLLTSLVDKSLVVAEAHRDRERYRFLETMRQYAEQKLFDAGEAETVRNSHRDLWLAISRDIAPQPGIGSTVGTARMLPEHDNIRAALGWCLANDGVKPGLEMAGLVHFLRSLPEQREWLEALLRRAPEPTAARAMTLLRLGHVLRWLHEFSLARGTAEEATALYRGLGDPVGEDDARAALGLALGNLGDYAGAIPQIEAGLASARTRRDTPKVVQYTRDLAVVSTAAGEFPRARAALEESMSLARQSEAAWPAHNASLRLALVDRLEGDHARSRARLDEVLGVIDDPTSWAGVQVRSALANLARTEGRPEEALTELRACLRDAMRHGYAVNEVLCMVGIAEIEAGRTARGVRTIAAGSPDDGPPGTVHMPDVRVEVPHYLARARETLGEAAYQEAWQAGRETPLERAVAAALADTAG